MGITLGSNFDVETGLPLDSRLVVSGLIQRDGIDSLKRYEGMIVYVESEAKNYQLVGGISNTDWAELSGGGSGGSGVKNFITAENSSLEDAINDWSTYNDSGSFVDGTGGVSGLTISITDDTSEVLDGVGSLKIFKPSLDCEGNGAVIEFDIPRGYRGKLSQISFLVDGTAQTGNDFEVRAYDVTNSKEIYCGTDDEIEIPKEVGEIKLPFQADSSCETARLCFNCKDSNTDAYSIFIDEVKVSPMSSVSVAKHTGLLTWSPTTQGFGTIGLDTAAYSINGNVLKGQIKFTAGTVTGDEAQVSLPNIELDTKAYSNGYQDTNIVGVAAVSGSKEIVTVLLDKNDSSVLKFGVAGAGSTGQNKFLGNQILTSTQQLTINFDLFVKDSRQVLNEFELSQQTVKARYSYNSSSARTSIANSVPQVIDYNVKDYDSHNCVTTGISWQFEAPKYGFYKFTAKQVLDTTTDWAEGEPFTLTAYKDGSPHSEIGRSIGFDSSSSSNYNNCQGDTTVELNKGQIVDIRSYQTSGASRSIVNDGTLTWITVEELPDFTTLGAIKNYATDSVYGTIGAAVNVSNTFGVATSLTIPDAGIYKVWGHIEAYNTTARTNPYWHRAFISENSGSSIADLEEGRNTNRVSVGNGLSDRRTAYIQPFFLNVPEGGTTLYLKQTITEPATDGTVAQSYNLSYERIR